MRQLLFALILGIFVINCVSTSNILFLLPVASKSHVHVFEPLIQALGERGHEITSYSPMISKNMPPNVQQIMVIPVDKILTNMDSPFNMRKAGKLNAFLNFSMEYIESACNTVWDSKELRNTMKTQSFDLIIVDYLMNQCFLGLLPHFKAPAIYVSTLVAPSFMIQMVGNRLPNSFVPSPFLEFSHEMTFLQRVGNLVFNLVMDVNGYFMWNMKMEKIYQEKMGITQSISEIDANVSMVLVNSHFTLTYPRPYLPDVVDVGGMHTTDGKPLPKDLDDFITGAEHGCILFSLGSIAQGSDMPEEARKIFLSAFSKLNQRVVWKWETETMGDIKIPKNVKLSKWLPQQDVLAHPNTKLFMSHGGLLSIQETLYHGVPVLGIPLFADQDLNIKQAEKAGFAQFIEILTINEETLLGKLNEMLNNPSYANRASELSKLWRDQPKTPLETAVYWSEYVIRHQGAVHLRSAARNLNFFQYHSLDVIGFIATILIVVAWIFIKIFKLIVKTVFGKICGDQKKAKKSTSSTSKKRN